MSLSRSLVLDRVIRFARGDFFKKYAPDSLYNTDPNAREIRDAVSVPRKAAKGGAEAMIKADIKTNLSGKHTVHREEIGRMEQQHQTRQGYLKVQGLTDKAKREEVAHRSSVAAKESAYAESYLGKKKPERITSPSGAVPDKELNRINRVVNRAPRKKLKTSEIQSAVAQRGTFASSMAAELKGNADIMRSARIATGVAPSAEVNQRLVKVLPNLRGRVTHEVQNVMADDKNKAQKLRTRVEGMARKQIQKTGKKPEQVETMVKDVTSPMFKPAPIGGENDLYDAPSISKKIGISKEGVEGVHRSHSKLIGARQPFVKGARNWKAERVGDVTRRVLQKGEVFSPLRSAMHASQSYPFLSRNSTKIKVGGAAAGLAIAGAGALVVHKLRKKQETQLSASTTRIIRFGRRAKFESLLHEAAGLGLKPGTNAGHAKIFQDRINSAEPGLIQTLADKARRGQITRSTHVAMRRQIGNTRNLLAGRMTALKHVHGRVKGYQEQIGTLSRENDALTATVRSQAGKHGAEKTRITREASNAQEDTNASHAEEMQRVRSDTRDAVRVGRQKTKRAFIIGGVAGGAVGIGTGALAGYGARRRREAQMQFDISRVGTATHDKVFIDGTRIDVRKLNDLVRGRKTVQVEIASLKGLSKSKRSGFSEERLKGARTSKPIWINSNREVVDGRHRCIKSKMKGDTHIHAIRVTKKDLKAVRLSVPILFEVTPLQNVRNKMRGHQSTKIHDVITGGVEGGVGILATDPLFRRLTGESKTIGSAFKQSLHGGSKLIGKKIAIGAGIGAAATGLIGGGVSVISSKRKDREPIRFATIPNRTAVTKDRYVKQIHEVDQDRAEHGYLRTAGAGAAIGGLLRKTMPIKKALLIGAGAGLGAQALTRIGTSRTKDQFGDRSYVAKRIDRLPGQLGTTAAIAIGTKKLLDHVHKSKLVRMSALDRVRKVAATEHWALKKAAPGLHSFLQSFKKATQSTTKKIVSNTRPSKIVKMSVIQLDDDLDRHLRRIARNPQGRAEEFYRNVGRGKRVLRDIREPGALDSRGRPRTPEWEKPWVKKAVGVALLGGAIAKGVKSVRALRATAAIQKEATGEARGLARVFDAGEGFFKRPPGGRSGMEKLIRSNRGISRPILRVHNEIKGIRRDASDFLDNKAEKVLQRWQGKPNPAASKILKVEQKNAEVSGVKERLKSIASTEPAQPGKKRKIPPLTQYSALDHVLRFAEVVPDWDLRDARGRSARIYAPGSQRRTRRPKDPWEKIGTERKVRDAIAIGTLATGAVGTHLIYKRAAARQQAAEFTDVPGQPGFRQSATAGANPAAKGVVATVRRRAAQVHTANIDKAIKNALKKV